MTGEAMRALPGDALVKKYIDKQGNQRRVGIPEKLKQSQWLGWIDSLCVVFGTVPNPNIYVVLLFIKKWFVQLRAYTAAFGDFLAKHAKQPPAAWLSIAQERFNRSKLPCSVKRYM